MAWRRTIAQQCSRSFHSSRAIHARSTAKDLPLIDIQDATFYRNFPNVQITGSSQQLSSDNPALFPGLTYSLPSAVDTSKKAQYWAVSSDSSISRTTLLQILAGQHVCLPPLARRYPFLANQSLPHQEAIRYVGFDAERGSTVGGTAVLGSYLSSRYESRREVTDYCVRDYLLGKTELNALEREISSDEMKLFEDVVQQLRLQPLLQMPVSNLSNGQTRRARIARALMSRPELLLLDGPFMGLDPVTSRAMDRVLQQLAESHKPRIILSLRPEDAMPEWISHVLEVNKKFEIVSQGPVQKMKKSVEANSILPTSARHRGDQIMYSKDGVPQAFGRVKLGEPLIEMQGVKVSYGDKTVLGNWTQGKKDGLWWNLRRGQRCGIFGPNGSGKTTMLSLITSDHPQTYSLPIMLFGRSRLPEPGQPGISIFDLQQRMGHSSPEVHAFFPKTLTVRRTLESAWSDAPLARPKLTVERDCRVDAFLRWFARELHPTYPEQTSIEALEHLKESSPLAVLKMTQQHQRDMLDSYGEDISWAESMRFTELSFSSQRLLLFLRALVHQPDLIILDEALSGVDEATRDKALLFLSQGETATNVINGELQHSALHQIDKIEFSGVTKEQALLVISHSPADVPGCVREWICLPDSETGGAPPRQGVLKQPLSLDPKGWNHIWDTQPAK